MQYSDKDMEALISEVEAEFNSVYKSEDTEETETQDLAKSEDNEVEVEAQAEDSEVETQELAKSEEDELNYDDEDIKEMNELYASMTKSEKEAHYSALKSVLFSEEKVTAEEKEEVVAKSEEQVEDSKEESDVSLLKAELEASNEKVEKLEKSLSDLVGLLHKNVKEGKKAPQQKAVTEIQYMKKSEDEAVQEKEDADISKLSKSEINAKLREKARSTELKKSDRERINAFVLENTSIDTIKDLL